LCVVMCVGQGCRHRLFRGVVVVVSSCSHWWWQVDLILGRVVVVSREKDPRNNF
jgi:hypothetical protein